MWCLKDFRWIYNPPGRAVACFFIELYQTSFPGISWTKIILVATQKKKKEKLGKILKILFFYIESFTKPTWRIVPLPCPFLVKFFYCFEVLKCNMTLINCKYDFAFAVQEICNCGKLCFFIFCFSYFLLFSNFFFKKKKKKKKKK